MMKKMKVKMTIAGTGLVIIGVLLGAFGASAAEEVRLMVNGKPSPIDIQLIDSVSYVPVRAVSEMLHAEVQWEESTHTVHIISPDYNGQEDGVYNLDSLAISRVQAVEDDYGWNVTAEVQNTLQTPLRTAGLTAVFYDKTGKRIGTATGTVYNLNVGQSKTVIFATTDELTGYDKIKFQSDFTS
jgi:hypothetical protein